jgi:hypothetical protein
VKSALRRVKSLRGEICLTAGEIFAQQMCEVSLCLCGIVEGADPYRLWGWLAKKQSKKADAQSHHW